MDLLYQFIQEEVQDNEKIDNNARFYSWSTLEGYF